MCELKSKTESYIRFVLKLNSIPFIRRLRSVVSHSIENIVGKYERLLEKKLLYSRLYNVTEITKTLMQHMYIHYLYKLNMLVKISNALLTQVFVLHCP